MQIEIYLLHLFFSKIYSLLSLLLIFIEHQSHQSSEIKTEHNWIPHESSSPNNDYCVQQDT